MKKVYICGVVASGKGLLRPLLDGHPRIITCPFQGFGLGLLLDEFDSYLRRSRPFDNRVRLAHPSAKTVRVRTEDGSWPISVGELLGYVFRDSSIKAMMDAAFSGKIRAAASQENEVFVDFDFDFTAFIKTLAEKWGNEKDFSSVERLQETLFCCFVEHWKNMHNIYDESCLFVQSAANGFHVVEAVLKRSKDRKIIIVMRDPVALSYTNTERIRTKFNSYQPADHYRKKFFHKYIYNPYDATLCSQGFIDRVRKFRRDAYNTARHDKDIYIVQFEDIVFNTKDTMDKIAAFLGIEPHDILYKATLNREYLEDESVNFVGKINDDPYRELLKDQVEVLKYLYDGTSLENTSSYNAYIAMLALKWKLFHAAMEWRNKMKSAWNAVRS